MKRLFSIIACFLFVGLSAQSYTPLINNESVAYQGYAVRLGETQEHLLYQPAFSGHVYILVMGASTPGQIGDAVVKLSRRMANVTFINVCVGSEDVNKWLSLTGNGWTNVKKVLTNKGLKYSDVDGILMCNDDLRSNDVSFPLSAQSLADKQVSLIKLCKQQFVNLKFVSLESRLCEYFITDTKFATPSGYHQGYANRFTVEASFSTGHLIDGVWVTDADAYIWTNGETSRSDGYSWQKSCMKQGGTSVHLNTLGQCDENIASYILGNFERYPWFY